MTSESLLPLLLVTVLLLAASLHGLSALGHFPRATRREALSHGAGALLLGGSILVVVASVTVAVVAAWLLMPWYAAIIAGGIAILIAPLVLQCFSDAFVDGPGALLAFAAATGSPAIILAWFLRG